MKRTLFIVVLAFACVSLSRACPGPRNIEGVAFTSGEEINLQRLMEMGAENVNYLKDGEAANISVRYRSHYDSNAMVFIGNYGLSYQQGIRMNCMGIVWPLADSADEYTSIDKETFNFAAAVKHELEWLVYYGILGISHEKIVKIDSILSIAYNGGMQFWTHANNTLGYNSWYSYDSLSGTWMYGGVDGVRVVEGVNGVKGCSVVNPGSGLPPAVLFGTTTIIRRTSASSHRMQPLAVRQLGDGGLIAFLPQRLTSEALVVVTDCKGAVVRSKRVAAGVQSVHIDGLARGHYTVRLGK